MGRFEDFWSITRRALRYTARRLGLSLSPSVEEELMSAWLRLRPYDDAVEALPVLAQRYVLVALTNGNRDFVERLLSNAGLRPYFKRLLTADMAGAYEPSPKVYHLVRELGVELRDAAFISSSPWDVAGAGAAGLKTCYVDRYGLPLEELDVAPDVVVKSLRELLSLEI